MFGFLFDVKVLTRDVMNGDTHGMKQYKQISASIATTDAKSKSDRRYRNIIANSGLEMESGEVRDIDRLYVMGRDGKLILISKLSTNPDEQSEKYSVNLATNHGHNDPVTGERVVDIEDIIGDAKVWLEDDGLHARVYFANNDDKADHAYAVSDNASYSIGTEWYEEGYYGAGQEIDGYLGILREISMVDTGNDPRAYTLDHKPTEAKASRSAEEADGNNNKLKKGNLMRKLDELTPDERDAMANRVLGVIDEFTTDAPENQTEPTRREATDEEGSEPAEKPAEAPAEAADKKVAAQPVIIIKDRKETVKQEKAVATSDWLHSEAGHKAFADTLKKAGRMGATFDAMWREEASKHMSLDGISGLPNPAPVEQYFIEALEKSDGIISHFQFIAAKSFRINLIGVAADGNGRAAGHKKGDTKQNQDLANTTRDLLVKMVYKRLDLDATELYENPSLIDFRSRELVNAILVEIERSAFIGDGRTYAGSGADYRMFDGTRGFYSILADATAASGIGTELATSVATAAGGNLYDGVVAARGNIKTEGAQYIVAKSSAITAMLAEKTANGYLVQPGARIEDILGVTRVYTPAWMDNASVDAFLVVDNAYKTGGERQIRVRSDFDTSTNTDILLDETPRFGSLGEYKSAVAITLTGASA